MAKSAPSSKARPLRALAVFLVTAGLVGLGVFGWRVFRGIELPRAPLANAPQNAGVVGYIRVQNVLRSEVVRRIVRREILQDRIDQLRERCGFDPSTQLEDLIVFTRGNSLEDLADLGLVARGPFEHERLGQCLREAFQEEGLGEMRMIEIDGVPAAAPANSEQRAAFLGQRGIAIGNEATVRSVIGTVRDRRPSAAADPVLARLWDLVASGRDIVLVGRLPVDWQQTLRQAVGVGPAAQFRGTIDQITAMGLSADVTRGLKLGGVVELRDENAARQVATSVRAQIDELTQNVLVSLTPFGPVLRSIRTEQRGPDFIVTIDLPPDRLERMIQFAEAYQQQGGARLDSGGTPPAAPGPAPSAVVPATP